MLVGFPGETDEEFRELIEFLDEVPFDRLGAFAFSPQDGTRAAGMEESFVPTAVAQERLEEVLEVQRAVSGERLAAEIGRERTAIVDGPAGADDPVPVLLFGEPPPDAVQIGRLESQADDVDGATALLDAEGLAPGSLVRVAVERAADFDLAGRVRKVIRAAPTRAATTARAATAGRGLPVLGLDSAWGR